VKRYRFRLEQVQRVRRVQEDLAAAALGAAQRAEAALVAVEQARRDAASARPRPCGAYAGSELLSARVVWDAELHALDRAEAERVRATLDTDERRDGWLVASRRVKALDLLDERRREDHRIESDREEAARVDDLVAGRFRRHDGTGEQ
jgi:flagellar export protein FliJ